MKNYVFSHQPPPSQPPPGEEFINAESGKDAWIMGGGGLIASFLDSGEIDEFIIHVIPTFIGEGIPLIHPRRRSVELALLSSRGFADGVVRLHYRVKTRDTIPG